jgi:hypothetical protein
MQQALANVNRATVRDQGAMIENRNSGRPDADVAGNAHRLAVPYARQKRRLS